MLFKIFLMPIIMLLVASVYAQDSDASQYTDLIQRKNALLNEGDKVALISEYFLGTPYKSSTLIGDVNTQEVLVRNRKEMDCSTFLDTVETFRLSNEADELDDALCLVRYQGAKVGYQTRNHFFTDWIVFNQDKVADVTEEVGGEHAVKIEKNLNLNKDGGCFLPGIAVTPRTFFYIPANKVAGCVAKLKSGDYVGFYTHAAGLDVTHVGIVIKTDAGVFLRHASSKETVKKVTDEDFLAYTVKRPNIIAGIIVLRPKKWAKATF